LRFLRPIRHRHSLTPDSGRHRRHRVRGVYDDHPLDEPDEWGDLASFRRAAAAS
jgi:hypothetical protein